MSLRPARVDALPAHALIINKIPADLDSCLLDERKDHCHI